MKKAGLIVIFAGAVSSLGVLAQEQGATGAKLETDTGKAVKDIKLGEKKTTDRAGEIFALTGLVSATPVTFSNQLSHLASAVVGKPSAGNSRYLYVYKIRDLANHKADQENKQLLKAGYVLAQSKAGATFIGAPIALNSADLIWLPKEASSLKESIEWSVPPSLSASLELKEPRYIAFSAPLVGVEPEFKVLATGHLDWRVYKDEAAVEKAAKLR